MKASKSNSSAATSRAPFAPATELEHVPVVFYEILYLAKQEKGLEIVPLIESVIQVTQKQADSLTCLPRMAKGGIE